MKLERLWKSSQARGEDCFHHSAKPFAINFDSALEAIVAALACGLT